jgi:MOSC domain-containing protein YiiM
MTYNYPISIEHIYISPRHNYFGKPKDGPGLHPTLDVETVELKAGRGLVGDRYYSVPAHYEAQVSFISAEVFEALLAEFQRDDLEPILTRRNIVTRGVNLNALIGHEFTIESASGPVKFRGSKQCSPCAWMDVMLGKGAQTFLRGRGGLRARILTDGLLQRGQGTLTTEHWVDVDAILEPLARPRLP